jgi:hypothetical protein
MSEDRASGTTKVSRLWLSVLFLLIALPAYATEHGAWVVSTTTTVDSDYVHYCDSLTVAATISPATAQARSEGIGNLVIYGDGFSTTGDFVKAATVIRREWNNYMQADNYARESLGFPARFDLTRSGILMIRNAQRTVEAMKNDAQFIRDLVWKTFHTTNTRIVVVSTRYTEMQRCEEIVFIPSTALNNEIQLEKLRLWFRVGLLEIEG